MPRPARPAHIRALPRSINELTDSQIETLINFGREEAQLLDELEAAVKNEDRALVWQIAQAICGIEDRVREKGRPAA
jgi:hypothetical protein